MSFSKSVFPTFKGAVFAILMLTTASSFAQNNELPDLGQSALTVLSIEKEKRLGEVLYNEIRAQSGVIHDPLIDEYINSLGNRLVAHSQDVKFPFTFFTINSPDINAFAFYGGHIGTHSGLITSADTESQLASVLAHEIAHVTQRHLARRQQAAAQQASLTLAGIVGSILLAMVGSPEAMMASMMATTAGAQQSMINYTRGNEQEADNIGMNVLATAGFDPYAAGEFFAKLQEQARFRTAMPQFLVTHPLPDSRVTDARLRAHQYEKRFYADSLDFLMVKNRILARFNRDKTHLIETFQERVKKARGNRLFAAQYGLALAFLDNKQLTQAEQILNQLSQQDPDNLYLLDSYSDLYIAKGQPSEFLPQLKNAFKMRPNNSVVTLNYANVLLEAKLVKEAIQVLEYYLLAKPNDFLATQILRSAYKEDQNMAKYHATSAEYFALVSNYTAAIQAADRALTLLPEKNRAEISRLEALKRSYRERARYIMDIKGKKR